MNTLKVFVFNVGQGDHILIEFPDGKYGVIDVHQDANINAPYEPPALTYLRQKQQRGQVIELAFIHLSHYHEDHIKGLDLLLNWVILNKIKLYELWLPPVKHNDVFKKSAAKIINDSALFGPIKEEVTSEEREKWQNRQQLKDKIRRYLRKSSYNPIYALDTLERLQRSLKFKIEYLVNGVNLTRANQQHLKGVEINVLAPSSQRAVNFRNVSNDKLLEQLLWDKKNNSLPNKNDISVVLKIDYGNLRLIFGGDAEKSSLYEVITEYEETDLEADFIKVFHHGAEGASSSKIWATFLRENQTVKMAISSGKNYDHPHLKTIEDIEVAATHLHTTTDIYLTKQTKDTSPEIIEQCIPNNEIEEILLDWQYSHTGNSSRNKRSTLDVVTDRYSKEESERIDKLENSYGTNNLLGYLFDFHVKNGEITVSKLLPV